MDRHRFFPDWYSVVRPDPDADVLDRKWAIVETLISETTSASEILEVVHAALHADDDASSPSDWLLSKVSLADPAARLRNVLEIGILCAVALTVAMSSAGQGDRRWVAAAMLVQTSLNQSFRSRIGDLYTAAKASLTNLGSVMRQFTEMEQREPRILVAKQLFPDGSDDPSPAALRAAIEALITDRNVMASSLNTVQAELARYGRLVQEQSDLLWTLLKYRSTRSASKDAAQVAERAKRLAHAIKLMPPPPNFIEFAKEVSRTINVEVPALRRTLLEEIDRNGVDDPSVFPLTAQHEGHGIPAQMSDVDAIYSVAMEILARNALSSIR